MVASPSAIKRAEKDMEEGRDIDLDAFRLQDDHFGQQEPPEFVQAKPRLVEDVMILKSLLEGDVPAVKKCRVTNIAIAVYLMGDASGVGFGSALWDGIGVEYEAGRWKRQWRRESSNFREASNLTARIEKMGADGRLEDKELFVFTDNTAYEGTFYKGHSKTSPKLTELVRRLRMVERTHDCIIHVIHIAGSRMKFAGVDGLSRSDTLEGIMCGIDPWDFVPLNEDANERSEGRVEEWVRSWWSDDTGKPWNRIGDDRTQYESSLLTKLEPIDWFRLHEINSNRLWIPPPAAMATVVELFNEDRIVNPHLTHVFVVPRLMTHIWRKQLMKDADLTFYVRAGAPFWPCSQHEPLTVLIVLPLAFVSEYRGPWCVKETPDSESFSEQLGAVFSKYDKNGRVKFYDMGRPMPSLRSDEYKWTRALLQQFLDQKRDFPPVQSGILRSLLPTLRGRPISHPTNDGGGRRRRKRLRDGG